LPVVRDSWQFLVGRQQLVDLGHQLWWYGDVCCGRGELVLVALCLGDTLGARIEKGFDLRAETSGCRAGGARPVQFWQDGLDFGKASDGREVGQ